MSERTVGGLGEWQTGALLVLGSALGGIVVLVGVAQVVTASPVAGVVGFLAGAVLGFLVLSYVLYGR